MGKELSTYRRRNHSVKGVEQTGLSHLYRVGCVVDTEQSTGFEMIDEVGEFSLELGEGWRCPRWVRDKLSEVNDHISWTSEVLAWEERHVVSLGFIGGLVLGLAEYGDQGPTV